MKLLIIRHAIAMERADFRKISADDSERPLTEEGEAKMRKNAAGLKRIVPKIDVLISSPLVRAEQTARIVSSSFNDMAVEKCDDMIPEAHPKDLIQWLKTRFKGHLTEMGESVVAVVGHEPHLSHLIGYLLTAKTITFGEMKKGGVCLIDFPNGLIAGKGELEWFIKPSVLRRLAKQK